MITPTVNSEYTYSTSPLIKGVVNLLAGESFVIKVTSPSLVDTNYTSFTIVGNTWTLQLSSLVIGVYTITPKVYETATPANFVTGTGTLEVAQFTLVIPFKSGARETLTWVTEILLSNNGKEQRRQLKSLPKMTLQGTYPVNTNINLTVANEIYSLLGKLTLIPLWHEAQLVPSIAQVDNVISIDTRYSSYKVGDYCLIFKKYSEYELVLIVTVTDTAIAGNIVADYTNAFVLPVKSGIITNNQSSTIGTSESLELSYLFKDLISVSQNSPSLFKSEDVYSDDWFVESELSSSLTNRIDFNNFETGVFTFSSPWNTNKVKANMYFILDGLQEIFEFKQFLYRRQGMLKPFWLSSYKSDFIPDTATIGTTVIGNTLKVLKNGFEKVFADKDNISIHFKDRSFTFTAISSITIQTTTIDLTLYESISQKYSDIAFISFVHLFRLDSDSIELSHETNGVVTCKIPIIECPFLAEYAIIATPSPVDEGETVTCSVTTSGVPDGTTLYWTILDITTEGVADVSPIFGSITISSGIASFNLSILTDLVTDDAERFKVQLRTDSVAGTIVATSAEVLINDVPSILTPITGQGGWHGGELNADEIYVVDIIQSGTTERLSRLFPINKTTAVVGSENLNLQYTQYDTNNDIVKAGNYFFRSIENGLRVHNADTSLVGTYTFTNQLYFLASDGTKIYTVENQGGAWGYTVKRNLIPTQTPNWIFDVDYPSNAQVTNAGVQYDKIYLDTFTNTLIQLTPYFDKVFILQKTPNNTFTVLANTLSGWSTNRTFNNTAITVTLTCGVNSTADSNLYSIIVSLPELGQIAIINKADMSVSYINITGILYTPTGTTSKPSFIKWLPQMNRFAVSCLGDNTVKFIDSGGNITDTKSTGLLPGEAFIANNILHIPCMGEAIINRFSYVTESITPTYSITSTSPTSVNEGNAVTITVVTTGIPNGVALAWTTTGTVIAADFTDNKLSGKVTIMNNTGTITRTLLADELTDGSKTFQIQLREGTEVGTVVATSSLVTVNDTSQLPVGINYWHIFKFTSINTPRSDRPAISIYEFANSGGSTTFGVGDENFYVPGTGLVTAATNPSTVDSTVYYRNSAPAGANLPANTGGDEWYLSLTLSGGSPGICQYLGKTTIANLADCTGLAVVRTMPNAGGAWNINP